MDNQNILITLMLVCGLFSSRVQCDTGFVLMRSTNSQEVEECSAYNDKFASYSTSLDMAKKSHVADIYPESGCDASDFPSSSFKDRIVMMKRHKNCTFAARAQIVQKRGGAGIIVVSDNGLTTPAGNDSEYDEMSITVSLITNDSYEKFNRMIQNVGSIDHVYVQLYAPEQNFWDPNAVVMWILAVFTCSLGAWLQGSYYVLQLSESSSTPGPSGSTAPGNNNSEDDYQLTVVHAVVFFGMCSVSILLMYFFYDYLVYVIISIFCIASCASSFDLLYSAFEASPCFTRHRLPPNRIPVLKSRPPVLGVALFLCCAGFSVFWAVNRKASYAWILQDVLGFTFCLHMIKQIRLPSYKISCILLILFFIYDIFYVFITPLLTKKGESIMVDIATGGGGTSNEELPMLFKLPRFLYSPYSKCGALPYSMLGYGDIILPGLHVGFCAVWDIRISNTVRRHAYFIAAVISYAVGIVLTYVGMYIMMMGQPALLYLAPCCLLGTLMVSLKRRELKAIWKGSVPTKNQVVPHNIVDSGEEDTLLERHEA